MKKHGEDIHHEPPRRGIGPDSTIARFLRWLISVLNMLREWPTKPHHDEHELNHYVQGQMVYYMRHDGALTTTNIDQILAASQKEWLAKTDKEITISRRGEILAFKDFSLMFVDVQNANDLEGLIRLLNEKSNEIFSPLTGEISPNWLIGTTVHTGSHPPSPGSWPVEASTPDPGDWTFWPKVDQNKESAETLYVKYAEKEGVGVDVAIIDTAPTEEHLDAALVKWGGHGVLEPLWRLPDRKLNIHTGISANFKLMDYRPVGHGYVMQDHGLFIAGIINSIAPQANLHLFKAFTPYGSASTETIAQSVQQIRQMFRGPTGPKRPLIVNCSFSLSLHDPKLPDEIKNRIMLDKIFNALADEEDVIIVAAAGNYINNKNRPPADYPAAYEKVIGVGALPKEFPLPNGEYHPASYSHLADVPPENGYMALGGEPDNGVLGIYTSEIPIYAPLYAEGCLSLLWRILTGTKLNDWKGPGYLPPQPEILTLDQIQYRQNNTGWAKWAGTSFAAPVVSGILANWCSSQPLSAATSGSGSTHQNITLGQAKQALNAMIQGRTKDDKEGVLPVAQG